MCINAIYALHALLSPFCAGKYKQVSNIAKVHKKLTISEFVTGSFRHQRSFGEVQKQKARILPLARKFQ